MKGEKRQASGGRTALFYAVFFFLVLLCAGGLAALIVALVRVADDLFRPGEPWVMTAFILMGAVSLLMGGIAALGAGHFTMKPVRKVTDAMDELARGNFAVRLNLGGFEEARRISDSFNRMAAELGSIETLRSDFANDFSHEFKTPIVSLRGFAKLLRDPGLSERERAEYLDIIISESDRLAALASNVLTLSRLENRAIAPPPAPFDLTEQLRRALALLEPKLEKKQLELTADLQECSVRGNSELLGLVWTNLLDNAVKFSPAGGRITLTLRQGKTFVEVAVADEGCGIPLEIQKHIFDRFYQGDRSHATQGAGVGLAIVRRALELCAGAISVESVEGEGSTFIVTLPKE